MPNVSWSDAARSPLWARGRRVRVALAACLIALTGFGVGHTGARATTAHRTAAVSTTLRALAPATAHAAGPSAAAAAAARTTHHGPTGPWIPLAAVITAVVALAALGIRRDRGATRHGRLRLANGSPRAPPALVAA